MGAILTTLGRTAAEEGRGALSVYARRKARLLFLRCRMEDDHPVIVAENMLVEMARSKLLEGLLSSLGEDGVRRERPVLEKNIREEMKLNLASLMSDPDTISALQTAADEDCLDSVFLPRGA